jgi:hypothetical protein
MIWGNGTCDNVSVPTLKYMELANNYTMDIIEIIYDGNSVSEVALTVDKLTLVLPGGTPLPDPPKTDILTDLDWLLSRWYYFAIVAGLICLIASISFRNTAIIIIGLVLLAAGVIGYYLAGDFSILDALNLSITPPNLTTWLQNLR